MLYCHKVVTKQEQGNHNLSYRFSTNSHTYFFISEISVLYVFTSLYSTALRYTYIFLKVRIPAM